MPTKPKFLYATILLLLSSLTTHADPLNSDSFGDAIMLALTLLFVDACSFLYFISLPFLSYGKINNWWTRFLSIVIMLSFGGLHFLLATGETRFQAPSKLSVYYNNAFEDISIFTGILLFAWLGFIVSTWRLIREFMRLPKEQ